MIWAALWKVMDGLTAGIRALIWILEAIECKIKSKKKKNGKR